MSGTVFPPDRFKDKTNIAQQGTQPERRFGRICKVKVLGRRRVSLVVRPDIGDV